MNGNALPCQFAPPPRNYLPPRFERALAGAFFPRRSLPLHGKNTGSKAAVVSPLRRDEHLVCIIFNPNGYCRFHPLENFSLTPDSIVIIRNDERKEKGRREKRGGIKGLVEWRIVARRKFWREISHWSVAGRPIRWRVNDCAVWS